MKTTTVYVVAPLLALALAGCAEKLPSDTEQVMADAAAAGANIKVIHAASVEAPIDAGLPQCPPGPRRAFVLSRSELEAGFRKLDTRTLYEDGRQFETMPIEGHTVFPMGLDPLISTDLFAQWKAEGAETATLASLVERTRTALAKYRSYDELAVYRVAASQGGAASRKGGSFLGGKVSAAVLFYDGKTGEARCRREVTVESSETVRATKGKEQLAVLGDLQTKLRSAVNAAVAGR